jgi:hypothetical protein
MAPRPPKPRATAEAREHAIQQLLHALESWRVGPAPEDLRSRICAQIAGCDAVPRVVAATKPRWDDAEADGPRIIRLSNFRDIAAVAAMIVLAVGIGVPSLLHMRVRDQRVACSWNLAQLGRGIQAYSATFGDSLPFAGWDAQRCAWAPSKDPAVATLPNRRHAYPLLALRLAESSWFICPSDRAVAMPIEQVARRSDFLEARNISYAYQNMAGARPSLRDHAALPVFGDDNPFFDNGLPLFEVAERLGLRDVAQTNSRAHNGAGQNILTLSGSVQWSTTPNCGVNGDNIWTLQHVAHYTGREGPTDASDSHLLK